MLAWLLVNLLRVDGSSYAEVLHLLHKCLLATDRKKDQAHTFQPGLSEWWHEMINFDVFLHHATVG